MLSAPGGHLSVCWTFGVPPSPTWEAQMALRGLDEGARQEGASAAMPSVPRACSALCRVSRATWSWWRCRALPSPGPVQPQSAVGLESPGTCPQGLFNFLIRTEGLLASQGTPMLTGGSGDRPRCVVRVLPSPGTGGTTLSPVARGLLQSVTQA